MMKWESPYFSNLNEINDADIFEVHFKILTVYRELYMNNSDLKMTKQEILTFLKHRKVQ